MAATPGAARAAGACCSAQQLGEVAGGDGAVRARQLTTKSTPSMPCRAALNQRSKRVSVPRFWAAGPAVAAMAAGLARRSLPACRPLQAGLRRSGRQPAKGDISFLELQVTKARKRP